MTEEAKMIARSIRFVGLCIVNSAALIVMSRHFSKGYVEQQADNLIRLTEKNQGCEV